MNHDQLLQQRYAARMRTDRFDYHLPPERIAQEPAHERDASRLLHLQRRTRTWTDRKVCDLDALLREGDLLVLNDTRVIPARLRARRDATGGQVEIFLLPPEVEGPIAGARHAPEANGAGRVETRRRVLTRSGGKLKVGETFTLADGVRAQLLERCGEGGDVLAFDLAPIAFLTFVTQHGEVPLPPYIKRPAGPSRPLDLERYQTVYAREPGAVAAPTAGLHFTPALFDRLASRGVQRATITLHVGPGTFKPVKAEHVEEHRVDPEPFVLSDRAADAVTQARTEGRRVVAVGTTVVRVLESRWNAETGRLDAGTGWADLYIRPPFRFQVVDALLTNFHLPKSSLLMLAAAFAAPGSDEGIDWVKRAYAHAVEAGYRFFSYGDACFFE